MSILNNVATVEEMAQKWDVPSHTVKHWCETGQIEARKMENKWVIVKSQNIPVATTPIIKIKGIKKAVDDFNKWQGTARIYFDKSKLKVWTNVYTQENEWHFYTTADGEEQWEKDENVLQVLAKTSLKEYNDKTTMIQLQELCEQAL